MPQLRQGVGIGVKADVRGLEGRPPPSARTAPDIPAALRMGRGSGSVMFDAGRKWADAARGRRDVSSLRSSRRARPVFVRIELEVQEAASALVCPAVDYIEPACNQEKGCSVSRYLPDQDPWPRHGRLAWMPFDGYSVSRYHKLHCQGRREIRPCGGAKVYHLSGDVQRKCPPATGAVGSP